MRTVELFSGTKSFSKVAKKYGHSTFTIDFSPTDQPDLCADILAVDSLPSCDILWASPPCTCFSVASIGTHWGGGYRVYEPKSLGAKTSLLVIQKMLDLINKTKPKYWFIENPRGVLRKLPIMQGLTRHTITYCQYGDDRMKPTDIWTNYKEWTPKKPCKNGDTCHVSAPRGSRTGTQGIKGARDRSRIPDGLSIEIFDALNPTTEKES